MVVVKDTKQYMFFMTATLGALQRKENSTKSEITMEVGGWVQVSLGFFFWKIIPK